MSTKTRSGRSVKPPARLVAVGFDDGNEKPMSTLLINRSKTPAKSVSWNQELTQVRYYEVDQLDSGGPKTRSFTTKLSKATNPVDALIATAGPSGFQAAPKAASKKIKMDKKKKAKLFKCDDCGKTFPRNLDVKIHIDGVHLKLKNFHCHVVGCSKSFAVKSSLQRHIKIVHEKMKPYSCPDCDSPFSTGHQLKLHKERAHDKIRHNCTFAGCAKNYSDPSNLKRHVKNKHH